MMQAETTAPKDVETRARIVETAEQLFREIGFQKTTVADIARELKMSPANVYRFFGSKAEINGAVARHLLNAIIDVSTAIVEGPGSAAERLRALVKNNEQMNAERFIGERKLHEMVEVALNDDWPIVTEYVQAMRMLMGRLVAEGVASGEFAAVDPAQGAALIQASTICYCHPRLMVECQDKPVPSCDEMVDFVLRALGA
ncbi:MAG: TetR family transcriptional regulator [Rhodoblastus sp.]|nr:TetR family transcriptional regulator [Rhodoblastus sp.]MCB9998615.1 TetR family transcriptional regulator [Methylobacteriaceae bacterium]HPG03141.1 TetR family transcriptional regulator [Rhodoblastus sp.]